MAHLDLREQAALNERDPERAGVVRIDLMNHDRSFVLSVAWHFHGQAPVPHRMHTGVHTDGLHAGNRTDAVEQFLEERGPALRIGITLLRQRNAHRQQSVCAETELHVLDRQKRPDHQTGAHQQHEGQRNFGNDQALAQECLANASRHASTGLAQRVGEVAGADVERRGQAESNAGERRHNKREQQDWSVERNLRLVRNRVGRNEGQDCLQTSEGENDTEDSPGRGKNQTLGEQLTNQARPARPQGSSHRHLLLPSAGF